MPSPEFMLTALIVVVVPGTGVIFTVSTAIARGTRAGIVAAIGCTLGIIPHLIAAALGITTILQFSATIFRAVRIVGVVYLLYLAYSMWRHAGTLKIEAQSSNARSWQIVGRAILLNLLNPKLTLFFLAFLPQFLPLGSGTPIRSMMILSGVFMLMTLLVFVAYGLVSSGARRVLTRSPRTIRWVQRSFAAALALFAVKLAFTDE